MRIKEKKVSDVLWKLFFLSFLLFFAVLVYLTLTYGSTTVQGENGKIFLLKILVGIIIWGATAVLLVNSINIAKDYESDLKWRKRDLQWMRERITKLEELLKLSETDLRKKMDQTMTGTIKIDNAKYQVELSTDLIPIESIGLMLEKSRDSFSKQYEEKKILNEPKIFTFWKKTLFIFLKNQESPEPQNGY